MANAMKYLIINYDGEAVVSLAGDEIPPEQTFGKGGRLVFANSEDTPVFTFFNRLNKVVYTWHLLEKGEHMLTTTEAYRIISEDEQAEIDRQATQRDEDERRRARDSRRLIAMGRQAFRDMRPIILRPGEEFISPPVDLAQRRRWYPWKTDGTIVCQELEDGTVRYAISDATFAHRALASVVIWRDRLGLALPSSELLESLGLTEDVSRSL